MPPHIRPAFYFFERLAHRSIVNSLVFDKLRYPRPAGIFEGYLEKLLIADAGKRLRRPLNSNVEAVEKVPKEIFERDVEKNELTECATINDLILGKDQVTPENIVLTAQKDFFYRLVMPFNP